MREKSPNQLLFFTFRSLFSLSAPCPPVRPSAARRRRRQLILECATERIGSRAPGRDTKKPRIFAVPVNPDFVSNPEGGPDEEYPHAQQRRPLKIASWSDLERILVPRRSLPSPPQWSLDLRPPPSPGERPLHHRAFSLARRPRRSLAASKGPPKQRGRRRMHSRQRGTEPQSPDRYSRRGLDRPPPSRDAHHCWEREAPRMRSPPRQPRHP